MPASSRPVSMFRWKGVLFILPVIVLIAGVYAYPIFDLFRASLFVTRRGVEQFVGFANYRTVLGSTLFWEAVKNSFLWTGLSLIIQLTLPILFALLLNQKFLGNTLARVLMLVPWVTPTVVVAIMLRWLLEPNVGLVNVLLRRAGIISGWIDFLGSPNSALITLVTANSWQFLPFGTLLILAGLQTIPRDVVEAAQVDGASGWIRFWHILFPLLGPVIGFVFFLAFVWNFNTLAIVWLTTQGGPLNRTLTLPVFIYRRAFRGFAMGEAAAMGAMASVLLALIGLFYFKYLWRKAL
ncbi:MAG: sugar ABC transporter permease [Thermosphaera sp.]